VQSGAQFVGPIDPAESLLSASFDKRDSADCDMALAMKALWESALGKRFGKALWESALGKRFGKALWESALAA
jgi:hypothetical protein